MRSQRELEPLTKLLTTGAGGHKSCGCPTSRTLDAARRAPQGRPIVPRHNVSTTARLA